MTAIQFLSKESFDQIGRLGTCLVSNAIERLHGRVRNEGSISGREIHCMFKNLPPMLGYAVTGRMLSTTQPAYGRAYHENMAWWRYVASIPEPRVLVVEDADDRPGAGALVGEMHARISRAMHCVGYVTNGSVRDLPEIEAMQFPLFAGSVSVTHMYAHIAHFGDAVEVGGLKVAPGDLLHGVQIIPLPIAPEIPGMAAQILKEEQHLRRLCESPDFTVDRLEKKLQRIPGGGVEVRLDGD